MLFELILPGETPAKKNSRIVLRNGINIPSKQYQQWHTGAMCEVFRQVKIRNISEPCTVRLEFVHGDLSRRDSDNGCSSIMDLLVDCNVLQDDNWQIVKHIEIKNRYEKNNAHCVIQIEVEE